VTNCTNVIEVTVSKHDAAKLVYVSKYIGNIRDDIVNSWVVSAGEQEAHVDNNHVVVVLDGHHVFTNTHFTKSTDCNNAKARCWVARLLLLVGNTKLSTLVAVINRFVHRNIIHVL